MRIVRYLFLSLLVLISCLFPNDARAETEFAANYEVLYEVDNAGVTTVTEKIVFKNLTDKYYASSFNLSIGVTDITDVSASDSSGPLSANIQTEDFDKTNGNKSQINIKFNQQVAGKGKEYPWSFKFKSKDFVEKQGKVWQISIPKIASTTNLEKYDLVLSVPVSFGDPMAIEPKPLSQIETGGRIFFRFDKDQLTSRGILASFGANQFFNFNLAYNYYNNNILPQIIKVPIPSDTAFQDILINKIVPKPENVIKDSLGNYLALFKVDKLSDLHVEVEGHAKIYLQSKNKDYLDKEAQGSFIKQQKYWETENSIIKIKLAEIIDKDKQMTSREKAMLINKFVVETLKYKGGRADDSTDRLGGVTALSNPDNALASEYTDLFITLARAADIPARSVVGYGYSSNRSLRPLSYDRDILHIWPEYYDPKSGWVMVDPTWESTTNGVDYFSKFDLNHLSLITLGGNIEEPVLPDKMEVNLTDEQTPVAKASIDLKVPDTVYAGFPIAGRLIIENTGSRFYPDASLSLTSSKIKIASVEKSDIGEFNKIFTPVIPPFGHLEYGFDLRTDSFLSSFEDILRFQLTSKNEPKIKVVDLAGSGEDLIGFKKIIVRPFISINNIPVIIAAFTAAILLIYIISVVFFFKTSGNIWRKKTKGVK